MESKNISGDKSQQGCLNYKTHKILNENQVLIQVHGVFSLVDLENTRWDYIPVGHNSGGNIVLKLKQVNVR